MGGADFLGLNTRQQEINKNSYQMQQVQKVQQQSNRHASNSCWSQALQLNRKKMPR